MMRRWLAGLACVLAATAAVAQNELAVTPQPAAPVAPAAASAPAQPDAAAAAPALTATDVGTWLDGFMPTTLEGGEIAGAQVVVVKDGQVLFKKGYGYADVAARKPMDVDRTLMRIGSTSKLFTWTAVMQLVQAGKLDLNADVNRYLDFRIEPKGGRAITLNDLMRHRGGFEEGLKDLMATDPAKWKDTERYLKENLRPQLFVADQAPAYSNYGTALAGYIVQRVSGQPYDVYIEQHILAPLRMEHTTFRQPLPPAFAPLMSKGYAQSDMPPVPFELVGTPPAGAASTTGADMANFMIAHLQDGRFGDTQILRPETARLMQTPAVPPQPGFDTLAHGFFWGHRNGRLVIGHGGDTIVFHTDFNLLPQEGVGFYASFNSRGENDATYGARERLFQLFLDRYFPAPPTQTPPAIAGAAADAAALAGYYEGSRRVESGFIGIFYLLQQTQLIPNEDGTISLTTLPGKQFREIAKGLWRDVDGTRMLQVSEVNGRRAILDSRNPVEVLQATPLSRNPTFNMVIAAFSVLVLLATVIAWPATAWIRRRYGAANPLTGRAKLAHRLVQLAALADLVYLVGWYRVLAPILKLQVEVYNNDMDATIRALQIAGIVPVVAAALGVWNAVLTWRPGRSWGERLRAILIAAALIGVLWLAWVGKLMSYNLNY
jgi:CubicO group peptidase (beta-lactamase class C family)